MWKNFTVAQDLGPARCGVALAGGVARDFQVPGN